jgi:hypothetical protein
MASISEVGLYCNSNNVWTDGRYIERPLGMMFPNVLARGLS